MSQDKMRQDKHHEENRQRHTGKRMMIMMHGEDKTRQKQGNKVYEHSNLGAHLIKYIKHKAKKIKDNNSATVQQSQKTRTKHHKDKQADTQSTKTTHTKAQALRTV